MTANNQAGIPEHPMDSFPVRKLEFPLDKIRFNDPLWSRSSPDFSMFINAMGVHVPYFERYLIKSMSAVKAKITDDTLLRDTRAIIGQEAHHAKNFIGFNKVLADRYPKIEKLDREARETFSKKAQRDDLKTLTGFTAGYETFTFLAGLIVLDKYDAWLKRGDPVMKAIWIWHQVEEVEHGAVAFDVYQHLYGNDERYRKKMVIVAGAHIAWEIIKAYSHMAKVEYGLRRPFRFLSSMGFLATTLTKFAYRVLPVFKSSYHPKRHPLVTDKQNRVQVAWRRYEHSGGNVLEIDRKKMEKILDIRPEAV